MVFLRDGLSWKLSAIRLPADEPVADSELLSIESSDMEADPAQRNNIMLSALLRNHAPHIQAYPNLELTLTDENDKPIARRTFRPSEYLPLSGNNQIGFAPNQELKVKIHLNVAGIGPHGPSSYRLKLFSPEQEKRDESTMLPTIPFAAPDIKGHAEERNG